MVVSVGNHIFERFFVILVYDKQKNRIRSKKNDALKQFPMVYMADNKLFE